MSKRISKSYNVRVVERAHGVIEIRWIHFFRERKGGGGTRTPTAHGAFTQRLIRAAKTGKLVAIKESL